MGFLFFRSLVDENFVHDRSTVAVSLVVDYLSSSYILFFLELPPFFSVFPGDLLSVSLRCN